MTKFILHGGMARKNNELNRSFYKEIVDGLKEGNSVLIVPFASRYDYTQEFFESQSILFKDQATGNKINFILATEEGFLSQVEDAEAIYIGGGSTKQLISMLNKYSDLRLLLKGKTIAGSSAGAYALVRFGAAHSEDVVRECLGFVPIRLICHYESKEEPPSPISVEALENTAQDLELVRLKDCEWKVFNV